ncbi:MAG TPA: pyridoxal phosphate-dependent aminotransferase [Clostridiaceae bacterium]|nr:pyridoxal phosphate-dependent aminotransferase [Clostridiaceae bacterium]
MTKINRNLFAIDLESGLYDIFQKATRLHQAGRKIIHMEIGKPDFDSPQAAKEEARKALAEGFVHYTTLNGIPELRQAIAQKEKRANNIIFDPETEIIVTAGACEAITCALIALFEPGDEIIIPSPYFQIYWDAANMLGLKVVEVPLTVENDFELDIDSMRQAITNKTRGLIINTPCNPTGKVISLDSLKEISRLAIDNELVVISDETYDQFVFAGKHYSLRNLPGMKERTVVVNSASKTFSMTGWRIGYLIADKKFIPYLGKIHQSLSTCATSFAQRGAAVAFRDCHDFTYNMVREFKLRRDLLLEGLSKIEGLDCNRPQGAFYVFPSIKKLGLDDKSFCDLMLDAGVAIAPGSVFGKDYSDYVRISYACSRQDIKEAVNILTTTISRL